MINDQMFVDLQAEVRRLEGIVRDLQSNVEPIAVLSQQRARSIVNQILDTPIAPVELPAHWRALSQILRNMADRIVHMTSANRGHVLKQLSDVEWSRWQGEWEKCVLCDTPTPFHEFDCPVQALETLMKVHGGVL